MKNNIYNNEKRAEDDFLCKVCGRTVMQASTGSRHRNHCPYCLYSIHLDNIPGDRRANCGGIMEPIGVWARRDGEWAVIHRCSICGVLHSNRIAADDDAVKLLMIALKPLFHMPFPEEYILKNND